MSDVLTTVRSLLQADAMLSARLARYDFGDGPEPAIFTIDPAPPECANPVMVLVLDGPENDVAGRGRANLTCRVQLKLWGDREQSAMELEALAWVAHGLLEKRTVNAGDNRIVIRCSVPQPLRDEDGYPGYLLRVSVIILVGGQ